MSFGMVNATLKSQKKTLKFHMIESQNKDFKTCSSSTIVLKSEKHSISKGLLKIRFNFDL
jgi:hypothetical protein